MAATLLEYCNTIITIGLLYFFLKKSLVRDNVFVRHQKRWWLIFGITFNLYSFSWLYSVYPLLWLPPGVLQIVGIAIIHLTLAIVAGAPFFLVAYSFDKRILSPYKPLAFAFCLMLAEVIRSLLISLLYYGEGATIDLHATTSTLGNALSATPLIEYAYFGGTFMLTFILGYTFYTVVTKEHLMRYCWHAIGIIILVVVIHFYVPVYEPQSPVTVGVVTTNFPTLEDTLMKESFKKSNTIVDNMTQSLASSHPDIIVYPEDTRYIEYLSNEEKKRLTSLFPHTLFVDGDTMSFEGKSTNVSLFYSGETGKGVWRGKSYLLPFNEYIPLLFKPVLNLFIPKDRMATYLYNHTYTPIHAKRVTFAFHSMNIGTLLCSEIISFRVIQNIRKENPSIVFFQSHLNVFHDNPWFKMYLYSFTKVAAAQLRRPLISSVNGAPSLVVSPYGKILYAIPTGFSTSTYILTSP